MSIFFQALDFTPKISKRSKSLRPVFTINYEPYSIVVIIAIIYRPIYSIRIQTPESGGC